MKQCPLFVENSLASNKRQGLTKQVDDNNNALAMPTAPDMITSFTPREKKCRSQLSS